MQNTLYAQTPTPGKKGLWVDQTKYRLIEEAILHVLEDKRSTTFTELVEGVKTQLIGRFVGSIAWYTTVVKLDMEVRNIIERVPGATPQQLRLNTKGY